MRLVPLLQFGDEYPDENYLFQIISLKINQELNRNLVWIVTIFK